MDVIRSFFHNSRIVFFSGFLLFFIVSLFFRPELQYGTDTWILSFAVSFVSVQYSMAKRIHRMPFSFSGFGASFFPHILIVFTSLWASFLFFCNEVLILPLLVCLSIGVLILLYHAPKTLEVKQLFLFYFPFLTLPILVHLYSFVLLSVSR